VEEIVRNIPEAGACEMTGEMAKEFVEPAPPFKPLNVAAVEPLPGEKWDRLDAQYAK
jgi:hypothetical protein